MRLERAMVSRRPYVFPQQYKNTLIYVCDDF